MFHKDEPSLLSSLKLAVNICIHSASPDACLLPPSWHAPPFPALVEWNRCELLSVFWTFPCLNSITNHVSAIWGAISFAYVFRWECVLEISKKKKNLCKRLNMKSSSMSLALRLRNYLLDGSSHRWKIFCQKPIQATSLFCRIFTTVLFQCARHSLCVPFEKIYYSFSML